MEKNTRKLDSSFDNSSVSHNDEYLLKIHSSIIIIIINYITGPLLAIVSFFIANNGYVITENSMFALLVALLTYVIGRDLAGLANEAYKRKAETSVIKNIGKKIDQNNKKVFDDVEVLSNEILKKIEETSEKFRKDHLASLSIMKVENDKLYASLRVAAAKSKTIRNSHVSMHQQAGVNTRHHEEMIEVYRAAFSPNKDTYWHDLCDVGGFLEKRYMKIFDQPEMKGRYSITVVNAPLSIINFIIFSDEDSQYKEVFFGWISENTNKITVFRSKDTRMIELFDDHFNELLQTNRVVSESRNMVDMNIAHKLESSVPSRLVGTWVGIIGDGNSLPEVGIEKGAKFQQYSIFQVKFLEDWNISGTSYDLHSGDQRNTFKSTNATIVNASIFYKFQENNRFGKLKHEGIAGFALADDSDIITGFYSRDANTQKTRLRAIKLSSETSRSSFEEQTSDSEKLRESLKILLKETKEKAELNDHK